MASIGFLQVEIKGTDYGLELLTDVNGCKVARLTKTDGTVYDVTEGADRTTCNCPDWQRRHAELPYSDGCKHIRAMVENGVVENVQPAFTFEPEPMISELGNAIMPNVVEETPEPIQATQQAPAPARPAKRTVKNLADAYRPTTLADVVGQDEIVFQLREFAEAPSETAFLFDGDTGVGKTSCALALAADLGCVVDQEELGGVYTIAAGNQLAEDVRETLRSLALRPLFGSGWKVLIVNECDRMSETVAYLWLDALENLPPRAVVVFSTNRVDKLPRRFLTRCERHTFKSDAESLLLATQARVNEVWFAETGRMDAPAVATLDAVDEHGQLSIRAALQSLTGHVRRAIAEAAQKPAGEAATVAKVESVQPTPADATTNKRRGRKTVEPEGIDWHVYGRRYAGGESYRQLAKEANVSPTLLWNRVKGLGYTPPKRVKV